jgi:arsenate reductase (thioredoxin)
MAEGLLRHETGDRFEVFSAGTHPYHVRPEAIAAMKELGIDISGQRSKSVDEYSGQSFEHVITLCDDARDTCPVFPGAAHQTHWGLEDPAAAEGTEEQRLAEFRRIRDQIRERIRTL